MVEPEKPAEEKTSPNQQVIEDLSWDIPFGRTIGNFFIREGKAVRNGWLAVLIGKGALIGTGGDSPRTLPLTITPALIISTNFNRTAFPAEVVSYGDNVEMQSYPITIQLDDNE